MTTNRDPLLPPPDVVDWLLEQGWSGVIPETFITYPRGGAEVIDSRRFDHCSARIEIGADEGGHLELPVEALEVLRVDRQARLRAIEQKRAAMEPDELERKRQRDEDRVDEAGDLERKRWMDLSHS